MTLGHGHPLPEPPYKLPELSIIETSELVELRATLAERDKHIARLKEDNESWKRENDAILRRQRDTPTKSTFSTLVERDKQIRSLQVEISTLLRGREQRDLDIEDLCERLANREREVADLKATVTRLRVNTLSNEDAKLLGIKKPFELEREIESLQADIRNLRERLGNRDRDVVNLTAGREADAATICNYRERALSAEQRAAGLQQDLAEGRRRSGEFHEWWLHKQLNGPGLQLPDGTYILGSNADRALTIKLEKR